MLFLLEFVVVVPVAFFVLVLIPFAFYLGSLQKTLTAISLDNRKIQPATVWLSFIPVFGLAWQFVLVSKIAESLEAEFNSLLGMEASKPGQPLGLAYSILFCSGLIPVIGILCFLVGLILWISYWVKINGYRKMLQMENVSR